MLILDWSTILLKSPHGAAAAVLGATLLLNNNMTTRESAFFNDMRVCSLHYLMILHDQIFYNGHSLGELYQQVLKWPVLVV